MNSLSAAERERCPTPALRSSHDKMPKGKQKHPLSTAALYGIARLQAKRVCGEKVVFHPTCLSERVALTVDEYPFVLSLATVLRIASRCVREETIHVRLFQEGGRIHITVSVAPTEEALMREMLNEAMPMLRDLARTARFRAELNETENEFRYHLSAAFCEVDASLLRAHDEYLAALVAEAFREAWSTTA